MCPFDSSVVNSSNNVFQMDSTAVLTNKITSFSQQMDYAEYYFIKMLAEFDLRKGWASGNKKANTWSVFVLARWSQDDDRVVLQGCFHAPN